METTDFIPSGATLIDCILGGNGWKLGHVCTIAGLPSSCKTGVSIEAALNFCQKFPQGVIYYLDAEARLELDRIDMLGADRSRLKIIKHEVDEKEKEKQIKAAEKAKEKGNKAEKEKEPKSIYCFNIEGKFVPAVAKKIAFTVEDLDNIVDALIDALPADMPGFLIVDSLDSISTKVEVETPLANRTGFRTEKSRFLGEFFRKIRPRMERKKFCLLIIQQVRDNVEGYGKPYVTSGGWAPDYYRSQALFCKQVDSIEKTFGKDTETIGITLHLTCEKNSTGRPFREATINYIFDYGLDDLHSCLDYLKEHSKLNVLPEEIVMKADKKGTLTDLTAIMERVEKLPPNERSSMLALIQQETRIAWAEVQAQFDTKRTAKYAR